MAVMTEGSADQARETRWSANKKTDAVLRLLRGEKIDALSRELHVEAHRLAAWRDEFLAAGKDGLKGGTLADDGMSTEQRRRLREAERKVGELTLDNDILSRRGPKTGARDPAGEAATVSTELHAPLARVCRVLDAPRSTAHYRRRHLRLVTDGVIGPRPGPVGVVDDTTLVGLIRAVLAEAPFCGEGYRKVRARLRREHQVHVSGKRVLRLMRREGLLAPQRAHRRRAKRLHEGSILTDAPDLRWVTDGTMAWTVEDGWVWVFDLVDHYTCEAWAHVAKSR